MEKEGSEKKESSENKIMSEVENLENKIPEKDSTVQDKIGQEQIHNLLFNRKLGWQELIYDLINTEQLDPWDIDLIVLTNKYLEKIRELEEADFFVSSKVLLAAALLLKIKSEVLLDDYIKGIDEILFGKKEKPEKKQERIEIEEEIPELIPRSPMPRHKKVTLPELMESLNKAIKTENRRIKKTINKKNALKESSISLPKKQTNIKDKITQIYEKITFHLEKGEKKKITFSLLAGKEKEERIASFFPILHLENQEKLWLEQEGHFQEIFIWLSEVYLKHNPNPFHDLVDKEFEELSRESKEEGLSRKEKKRLEKIDKKFSNPMKE